MTSTTDGSDTSRQGAAGLDKSRVRFLTSWRTCPNRTVGAFLVTLGCFAMVAFVLQACIENVATAPLAATKSTGPLDSFANAKDLLAIVLPTLSAALGFWFGSDGKAQAQAQAQDSAATAKVALQDARSSALEAKKEHQAKTALIAAADDSEQLLTRAKELFPGSFSD